MVSGQVNKSIVAHINEEGGRVVGLSARTAGLYASKSARTKRDPDSNIEKVVDLGFVGEPEQIDPYILEAMSDKGIIPVVAPIGWDAEGDTYNINADTVAGALAGALNGSRLLMLTDVSGVLDRSGTLMPDLTVAQCRDLQDDGTISGGMIPKVETCIDAVNQGVEGAVIIDGRVPHGVLLEFLTEHGLHLDKAVDGMSNERVTADVWVFDLDNTLYPRDCDLFAQIDVKMKAFVSNLLDIDPADAYRVQKQYFREHGSTLRGLMDNHGLALLGNFSTSSTISM